MNFDQSFDVLIGHEGGYSNNPADPGGETMWGITWRVARNWGYVGAMKDLPRETAKEIYKALYWDKVHADQLPEAIKFDTFDAAVNSGVGQAIRFLQQAAGLKGGDVDGAFGPKTMTAVRNANPQLLDKRISGYRLRYMASLKNWPNFARGWANRIAANLIED